MRSIVSLMRVWALSILRDRSTVFWSLAFPVLFVVLFGLAFGRNETAEFSVGVAMDKTSPVDEALLSALEGAKAFQVHPGNLDHELKALEDGDRYAVVAARPAPAAAATAGTATEVVVYYDPSRGAAAQIVLPIIQQIVGGVNQQLTGQPPQLVVRQESVRSANLKFIDFFLPGVVGFSIMQTGMFAAIPFVQLRVTRVLKRLNATPVSRAAVLVSQAAVRLVLGVIQTLVLLLVGRLLFDIHISSNVPGMASFVLLGGLTFLGLGLAISGLAKTEESVPALVQAVSFPMMFLAGVFWPIENFPPAVQVISRILPLTFLGDGLRQVMVGGAALNPLWLDYLVLAAWGAVAALLAVRFFRWE